MTQYQTTVVDSIHAERLDYLAMEQRKAELAGDAVKAASIARRIRRLNRF